MAATPVRAIASPLSYESSPLSEIEVLEREALATIVSFKHGHLSRRSSTSSFLSFSATFSTSSLSSLADVAAAEVWMPHRIVDITYDRGLKRGGNWVSAIIPHRDWLSFDESFFFALPSNIFSSHAHLEMVDARR
jgi:hypothetical protein